MPQWLRHPALCTSRSNANLSYSCGWRVSWLSPLWMKSPVAAEESVGYRQILYRVQLWTNKPLWIQLATAIDSKFQTCKLSRFQNFKISKFQNFKLSNFQNFKISKFQNFKISKFQTFKISKFQNFKISKFQHFNILKFQNFCRFRGGRGNVPSLPFCLLSCLVIWVWHVPPHIFANRCVAQTIHCWKRNAVCSECGFWEFEMWSFEILFFLLFLHFSLIVFSLCFIYFFFPFSFFFLSCSFHVSYLFFHFSFIFFWTLCFLKVSRLRGGNARISRNNTIQNDAVKLSGDLMFW